MSDIINCPDCGAEIKLSENLAAAFLQKEREAMRKKWEEEREAIARKIKLEEQQKSAEELSRQAQESEALRRRIAEQNKKLDTAQKEQAEALKLKRMLEDEKREMDLTIEKKLAEEREAIRQRARQEIESNHALKLREEEQKNAALRKQIDELKRKSEQGSQQHQGEILETALEELLTRKFPYDEITEIKKGESGADILQKVMSPNGKFCGSILWETKRVKNWSGSWIAKLKADQRAKGAKLAVLLSTVLPKEMKPGSFGQIDGVWVTGYESAISMVGALRMSLIEVTGALAIKDGQKDKAELIYEYLTGTKFKHRVEAIVEKFEDMRQDLQREKKFYAKQWAKREGQIEAVIGATMGMRGDLEAIAGKSMPQISGLDDNTDNDLPLIE